MKNKKSKQKTLLVFLFLIVAGFSIGYVSTYFIRVSCAEKLVSNEENTKKESNESFKNDDKQAISVVTQNVATSRTNVSEENDYSPKADDEIIENITLLNNINENQLSTVNLIGISEFVVTDFIVSLQQTTWNEYVFFQKTGVQVTLDGSTDKYTLLKEMIEGDEYNENQYTLHFILNEDYEAYDVYLLGNDNASELYIGMAHIPTEY